MLHKKLYHGQLYFALINVLLEFARIIYTGRIGFVFLIWNIFLAAIPLVISYNLLSLGKGKRLENIFCFTLWLLILPNAPYLITDILHFGERHDAPLWFDVSLLFSFALNGLCMGIISTYFMYLHLQKYLHAKWLNPLMLLVHVACGFGVYVGRYLRWNSWSIITHPMSLLQECFIRVVNPIDHPRTWLVTIVFAMLIGCGFTWLKNIVQYSKLSNS